jgi:hypothetical protein
MTLWINDNLGPNSAALAPYPKLNKYSATYFPFKNNQVRAVAQATAPAITSRPIRASRSPGGAATYTNAAKPKDGMNAIVIVRASGIRPTKKPKAMIQGQRLAC